MFLLDQAPTYGRENPQLYCDAFGISNPNNPTEEYGLSFLEILALAAEHTQAVFPTYDSNTLSPEAGRATGSVNCIARSAFFHTLVSPFTEVEAGLVVVWSQGAGSAHCMNNAIENTDSRPLIRVINNVQIPRPKGREEEPAKSVMSISDPDHVHESCYGGVATTLRVAQARVDTPAEHRKPIEQYWFEDTFGYPLIAETDEVDYRSRLTIIRGQVANDAIDGIIYKQRRYAYGLSVLSLAFDGITIDQ